MKIPAGDIWQKPAQGMGGTNLVGWDHSVYFDGIVDTGIMIEPRLKLAMPKKRDTTEVSLLDAPV